MATVNFLLRSNKVNNPFTIRFTYTDKSKVTEGNPHGMAHQEARTEIFVFEPFFVLNHPDVDGKDTWRKYAGKKITIPELNQRFERIYKEQEDLRYFIFDNYNADSTPRKDWLKELVKTYYDQKAKERMLEEKRSKPLDLVWHFDNYLKIKELDVRESTLLKLRDTKNIIAEFEKHQQRINRNYKVLVNEVDEDLKADLVRYLTKEKKYSRNTIAKTIKVIRTICNYAKQYIPLSLGYDNFTMAYEATDVVFLSFEELQKIKEAELPEHLEDSRNWLYISCFLGQRIGDFMRFTKDNIKREDGEFYIDFRQEKTDKKMHLPIHPEVLEYLQANNLEFPKAMDPQKYNDQIKDVCELAGIDNWVNGAVLTEVEKGVWRNVEGKYPKYKVIGSHIGRKSFCTNFYDKMPTSLIMEISGHTEESTLLSYIGKERAGRGRMINEYFKNINTSKIQPLQRI